MCAAEGTVDWIIVLEDIGGKTVLIDLGAVAGKFEDFIPGRRKSWTRWSGKASKPALRL